MHPISKQGSTRKRNSPPHTAKFCMPQPAAGGAQQSRPSLPQAELNMPQPAAGGAQHTTARRRRSSACLHPPPPQAELSTPRGAPHVSARRRRSSTDSTPQPAAGALCGAQPAWSSARLGPPRVELSPPLARLSQPLAPLDAHLPQRRKRIVVRTSPPRWWPATRTVLRASPPQEEAD